MLVKTEAIVLHSLKYGETRLIVDLFTREAGRLSCIVPLPKTPRSRLKKQYFQPMTLLEVEIDLRQRLQLQKMKDARLLSAYATIPFSSRPALRTEKRTPLRLYLRFHAMARYCREEFRQLPPYFSYAHEPFPGFLS